MLALKFAKKQKTPYERWCDFYTKGNVNSKTRSRAVYGTRKVTSKKNVGITYYTNWEVLKACQKLV